LDIGKSRDGVLQADMYQMYAYSRRYATVDVVLLYPHHGGLGDQVGVRAEYNLLGVDNPSTKPTAKIRIATVDLRDLTKIPEQLGKLFEQSSIPHAA
jgi:5-methylcytosine-specific restriction enzyme subunit McrC